MIKSLIGVRDVVAEDFPGGLLLVAHDAPAVRMFSDLLGTQGTIVNQHPNDHDLVEVAKFNVTTGEIEPVSPPRVIMSGATWVMMQSNAKPLGE